MTTRIDKYDRESLYRWATKTIYKHNNFIAWPFPYHDDGISFIKSLITDEVSADWDTVNKLQHKYNICNYIGKTATINVALSDPYDTYVRLDVNISQPFYLNSILTDSTTIKSDQLKSVYDFATGYAHSNKSCGLHFKMFSSVLDLSKSYGQLVRVLPSVRHFLPSDGQAAMEAYSRRARLNTELSKFYDENRLLLRALENHITAGLLLPNVSNYPEYVCVY